MTTRLDSVLTLVLRLEAEITKARLTANNHRTTAAEHLATADAHEKHASRLESLLTDYRADAAREAAQ